MSSFLWLTALMIWVVVIVIMIAGFYLIRKILWIEREVKKMKQEHRYD